MSMKKNARIAKIILYLGVLFLLFPRPAHAYIDPGNGSYLLQITAGILFSALFFFKNWWGKIKGLFLKIFTRKDEQTADNTSKKND